MADGSGAGEQQVRGENTQENKVVSRRGEGEGQERDYLHSLSRGGLVGDWQIISHRLARNVDTAILPYAPDRCSARVRLISSPLGQERQVPYVRSTVTGRS
jgi:hypothetical protein